ncbi:PRAME family member 6 [Fukomys damarensis]|uniref:PRAME family member 6 n=1 Tax=Fukomys damarensis TaxID=885580 RepID=A0A091DMY4_FUKDA|nr:PRAME family member 6 [Fukomys damarensis]KFO31625.1 PRAME family member 6 [Fukomys damarensis]
MSTQSPPTLYELAKQSLLSGETAASAALYDLPTQLFHELFVEAFLEDRNEALKAMVQAWPFPCLPLRTLMDLRIPKTPLWVFEQRRLEERNLETFEALLDGLDRQLSQKVHPSRRRLRVLDWRDVHRDFWTSRPGTVRVAHSGDASSEETGERGPRKKKPSLTVLAQLHFESCSTYANHDALQVCLLKWVRKRRAAVHLLSEKVTITSCAVFHVVKLLRAVQLDSIREVHVLSDWTRESMRAFVPQLKKMKNLHTFRFGSMDPDKYYSPSKNKWHSRIYAYHLGQMQSLRELHIDKVFFLEGKLHKIFRNQKPLEALSLSASPLKESDLKHLIQCPTTNQLKSLTLRMFSMESFNLDTLLALLDKLSGTLETLVLERCGFTDSHILAILPVLHRCSQLKTFSCFGNRISLCTLRVLLWESAGLSQLTHGLYPAPLESYNSKISHTVVDTDSFVMVCARLARVLKKLRPSLRVQICTYFCIWCMNCRLYGLDPSGKWEVTEEYRYPGGQPVCYCCEVSRRIHDMFSW